MATNGDGPSFFARFIDEPEKPRLESEKPVKRPRKNTDRVSRWKRKTDAEIFLKGVLTNGPMPTAVIEELGAARRFSKRQLECAKQRIGATAFKKKGKLRGCWFWTLEPGTVRKPHSRYNPLSSRPLEQAGLPASANRQSPSPEPTHVGGNASNFIELKVYWRPASYFDQLAAQRPRKRHNKSTSQQRLNKTAV